MATLLRRMLRIVCSCVAAALLMLVFVPAPAATTRGADLSFSSKALGARLHYEVYLPVDYSTSGRRYPVVYFLHGLPAAPTAYRSLEFVEQGLERGSRPAILVVAQGARHGESDPEYLDRGRHDDWDTALAKELPRVVDARFRTIADRAGRAVIGLSAGGYGALHLALGHLDEFSAVESWSGYFQPTNPAGTRRLELGSAGKDAKADVHRQVEAERRRLRSLPLFIAFYVGRSDTRFAQANLGLHRQLEREHLAHVFRLYRGGHSQSLWQTHAEQWLGLALSHLGAAR
jgi:enterochelin esterase-like enzyme